MSIIFLKFDYRFFKLPASWQPGAAPRNRPAALPAAPAGINTGCRTRALGIYLRQDWQPTAACLMV
ncbi:MAG: hypothetical protein ACYC6L_02160 [Anaerolineae bacterium]